MKRSLLFGSFLFFFTLAACKKETEENKPQPSVEVDDQNFIRFKVGDSTYTFDIPGESGNFDLSYTIGGDLGPGTCDYIYGASILDFSQGFSKSAGIQFDDFFYQLPCGDTDEFADLFPEGNYDYVDPNSATFAEGVSIIARLERDGDTYYSDYGSGDQTGSSFAITASTDATPSNTLNDYQSRRLKGTFTCKLYNANDVNDIITLTDGELQLLVQSYGDE